MESHGFVTFPSFPLTGGIEGVGQLKIWSSAKQSLKVIGNSVEAHGEADEARGNLVYVVLTGIH